MSHITVYAIAIFRETYKLFPNSDVKFVRCNNDIWESKLSGEFPQPYSTFIENTDALQNISLTHPYLDFIFVTMKEYTYSGDTFLLRIGQFRQFRSFYAALTFIFPNEHESDPTCFKNLCKTYAYTMFKLKH